MALSFNFNSNISAINTQRHMNLSNVDQGKRLECLSSGRCLNGAEDEAAGLNIAEGFRVQLSRLT